jgi:hypothetical protein
VTPLLDLTRLTRGEAIAAGSAMLLVVVMFLPWFSEKAPVTIPGLPTREITQTTHNAWESLGAIDVLLVLVVVLTLAVALAHAAGLTAADPVLPPSLFVAAAGLFAVALILYRLIDPPGATIDLAVGKADVGRQLGIVLGLLAAAGISLGGYLTLAEGQEGRQRS